MKRLLIDWLRKQLAHNERPIIRLIEENQDLRDQLEMQRCVNMRLDEEIRRLKIKFINHVGGRFLPPHPTEPDAQS